MPYTISALFGAGWCVMGKKGWRYKLLRWFFGKDWDAFPSGRKARLRWFLVGDERYGRKNALAEFTGSIVASVCVFMATSGMSIFEVWDMVVSAASRMSEWFKGLLG